MIRFGDKVVIFSDNTYKWKSGDYGKVWPSRTVNNKCPYCKISDLLRDSATYDPYGQESYEYGSVIVCGDCGWWQYNGDDNESDGTNYRSFYAEAILREFEISSSEVPVNELLRHLTKYKDRLGEIHPKKMEELVASIFKEYFGYKIEFCSYCRPDKGIDIIAVEHGGSRKTAIQVKRYNRPIEIEQIHAFCGALVHNRHDLGIFVTSSGYRKGAQIAAKELSSIANIPIDLIDGKTLLNYIGILSDKKNSISLNTCPLWKNRSYKLK